MKYWLAGAMVTVCVLAAGAALLVDDSDADNDTYIINGIVVGSDGSVNPGLAGTRIAIEDYVGYVDADGYFSVRSSTADDPHLYVSFPGYIASTPNDSVVKPVEDNYFELLLSRLTPTGNVYDISEYPIKMTESRLSAFLMESGSSEDIPLVDVEVTLTDGFGNEYTAVTDETGLFNIGIGSRYDLTLAFALEGYTPIPGINFMAVSEGKVVFDLQGYISQLNMSYSVQYTTKDNVTTYTIPQKYPILTSPSTGDVTVNVQSVKGTEIQGCNITLTSSTETSRKYTQVTDKNGTLTIHNVRTGTYIVSANVGGFESFESEPVEIMKGSNPLPLIVLEQIEERSFFGMNLSHFLMVLGIAACVIMVTIATALFFRTARFDGEE